MARRILFVVHARYPTGEPRVQRQAAAARDAGWDVHVLCLRHAGEARREVVAGVGVHRLPVRHRRGSMARMAGEYLAFTVLATAATAWLHLRRRFDVIHVSNPPDLLVVAGLLPRLTGARIVLDVHDLTADMFEWRFAGRRVAPMLSRSLLAQERLACRLVDGILTVHEPYADVLRERSAPGRRIEIVMNSLDENLLPPHLAPQSEFHAPARLIYHGTLTRLYGVHVLIDALAQGDLRDRVHLTLLGDGDMREEIERRVLEHELQGCVELSGVVPIEQALARVLDCDIGVVPLDDIPFTRFALPSKLFEYVACERPVIASRTETMAAHFGEDELTYARAGDAGDLARAITEVLDDPAAAIERARRARARYEAYRWPHSAERLLSALAAG